MTNLAANLDPRFSDDASSSLFSHARPVVHRNVSQQPRAITTTHVSDTPIYRRSNRLYIDENNHMNFERASGRWSFTTIAITGWSAHQACAGGVNVSTVA